MPEHHQDVPNENKHDQFFNVDNDNLLKKIAYKIHH